MKKIKKIYLWFLFTGLIYGGILLRWIGTKNEHYETNGHFHEIGPDWISGFEISGMGALGIVVLVMLSFFNWIRCSYWIPALLLPCLGISIYVLGSTTEYVDAHGRLRESLPFLAGGSGIIFGGTVYSILLALFGLYKWLRSKLTHKPL